MCFLRISTEILHGSSWKKGLLKKTTNSQYDSADTKTSNQENFERKVESAFLTYIELKDSFFFGHFYFLRHYKVRRNT